MGEMIGEDYIPQEKRGDGDGAEINWDFGLVGLVDDNPTTMNYSC